MTNTENGREIANQIILSIEKGEMKSHDALLLTLKKYQYLEKRTRGYITRLVEGVLERKITLDYIINNHASVKVKKMKPLIRCILRSAVYEIYYMDSIPDRAATSEAVEMTKKHGFRKLSGFVNGVLRSIIRSKGKENFPNDKIKNMSVTYSMPEEIIKEWLKRYDEDMVKRMCAAALCSQPITVRPITRKITLDNLKKVLEEEGLKVSYHEYGGALNLEGINYLGDIKSFNEGLFTVQDGAGILAINLSKIEESDEVLDMCASPGGKALHAADLAKSVLARDVSDRKVEFIEENALRLGAENIKTEVFDATVFDEESVMAFDKVICDLPCSGLGVMGRKADIKYNYSNELALSLEKLQSDILDNAAKYVKKGGVIIYSTCTVREEENLIQVKNFLDRHKDFVIEPIKNVPEILKDQLIDGTLSIFPGVNPSDGFFVANLRRKKD